MAINIQNIIAALEAKVAAATSQTETQELIVLIKTIKASGQQTLSSYASSTALPAGTAAGTLAYVVDAGALFFSNGTTWAQVGTGAGGGTGGGTAYDQSLNTTNDVVFNSALIGDVAIIGNQLSGIDSYGGTSLPLVVTSDLDVKLLSSSVKNFAISGGGVLMSPDTNNITKLRFKGSAVAGDLTARNKNVILSLVAGDVATSITQMYGSYKIEVTGSAYTELDYYGTEYLYLPCNLYTEQQTPSGKAWVLNTQYYSNTWFWGAEFTCVGTANVTPLAVTLDGAVTTSLHTNEVIASNGLEINKVVTTTDGYKQITLGNQSVNIDATGALQYFSIDWSWAITPPSASTQLALSSIGVGAEVVISGLLDQQTYNSVEFKGTVTEVELVADQYNPTATAGVRYYVSSIQTKVMTESAWSTFNPPTINSLWYPADSLANTTVSVTGGTHKVVKNLAKFNSSGATVDNLTVVGTINNEAPVFLSLNSDKSKSILINSTTTKNYSNVSWMEASWLPGKAIVMFNSMMGDTYPILQTIAAGDTFKLYDSNGGGEHTFTCVSPITYNMMYGRYEIAVLETNPNTTMSVSFVTSSHTPALVVIKPIVVKSLTASDLGVAVTNLSATSALIGDVAIVGNTITATNSYGVVEQLSIHGDLEVTGNLVVGNTTGTPNNSQTPVKYLKSYVLDLVASNYTVGSYNLDQMYSSMNGYNQNVTLVTNNSNAITELNKLKVGDHFAISAMYGSYSNLVITSVTKTNGGGMPGMGNVTYAITFSGSAGFGQDGFYGSNTITFTTSSQVKTEYYVPLYQ